MFRIHMYIIFNPSLSFRFNFSCLFCPFFYYKHFTFILCYPMYWVTQKLPKIYTAKHATFQIQMRKITVQLCDNFWVTQYVFILCIAVHYTW